MTQNKNKLSIGKLTKFNLKKTLKPVYSRLLNQNIIINNNLNSKPKIVSTKNLGEYSTKQKSENILKSVMPTKKLANPSLFVLKNRVLDITKLNNNIDILSSIDKLNKDVVVENNSSNINTSEDIVVSDSSSTIAASLNKKKLKNQSEILSSINPKYTNINQTKSKAKASDPALGRTQRTQSRTAGRQQQSSIFFLEKAKPKSIKTKNSKIQLRKYLKSITKFDVEIAQFQSIVYNFNNNKKKFSEGQINSILDNTFYKLKCLISRPVYEFTPSNLNIYLFFKKLKRIFFVDPRKIIKRNLKKKSKFKKAQLQLSRKLLWLFDSYFINKNSTNKSNMFMKFKPRFANRYLKYLILFLSNKIKKPINLDLTLLKKSYFDSKILANDIGLRVLSIKTRFLFVSKDYFRILKRMIVQTRNNKKNLNNLSGISGINIKKGGRLMTEPFIPKKSFKILQRGSIKRANADFVSTSRFTSKNLRGAFSITVTIGHKFF